MSNISAAFLSKNKDIQSAFIIYEGILGTILLGLFIGSIFVGGVFVVVVLALFYIYDFTLNYLFLKEVVGNNNYYAKAVAEDPKRIANALVRNINTNESEYLKEYSTGFRIRKGTVFNRYWVSSLDDFYSGLTRNIETSLERRY